MLNDFKDKRLIALIIAGLIAIFFTYWNFIRFSESDIEFAPATKIQQIPSVTPPTSPPPGSIIEGSGIDEEAHEHQSKTYTISMEANAYVPSSLTIQHGDIVRFVNNDTKDHWPASKVHPAHTAYPEFDPLTNIRPGEDWSFTFEKEGDWGMHDHLMPFITGTIFVE